MMQDARLAEQPVRLSCESEHRSPELSVIVPTFNEAPNVELVVEALVASLSGIDWEVIFVDDDSSDGTTNVVRLIARCDGRVRCIRRIGRRGLSSDRRGGHAQPWMAEHPKLCSLRCSGLHRA